MPHLAVFFFLALAASQTSTPVGNPSPLQASAPSSAQVNLKWDSFAQEWWYVQLERRAQLTQNFYTAWTTVALFPATSATSYVDLNAPPGFTYEYRLRMYQTDFVVMKSPLVAVPSAKGLESDLAVSLDAHGIVLSSPSRPGARHIDRREGAAGPWVRVGSFPAGSAQFFDYTVKPLTAYSYRLRTEDGAAYTNAASATTATLVPRTTAALAAAARSAAEIQLGWPATAFGPTLLIERRQPVPTYSGGWSVVATVPGAAASFVDINVKPDTTYEYRVASADGGFATAVAQAKTPAGPAQEILTAPKSSAVLVTLAWTSGVSPLPGYFIDRRSVTPLGAASEWTTVAQVIGGAVSYPDVSVQPNRVYDYRLRSKVDAVVSNIVRVTVPASAPAGALKAAAAAGSVTLAWTLPAGGMKTVVVERRTYGPGGADSGWKSVFITSAGLKSFTDKAVAAGTLCRYRVRTIDGSAYTNGVLLRAQ